MLSVLIRITLVSLESYEFFLKISLLFGTKIFEQTVDISKGTNCSPSPLARRYVFVYNNLDGLQFYIVIFFFLF